MALAALAVAWPATPALAGARPAPPAQAPAPQQASATADSKLAAATCTSASACWAVGYDTGSSGAKLGEAFQWGGSIWTRVSVPEPGGQSASARAGLAGVACASSSDCWAVGYHTNSSGAYLNEALHWNGSQWTPASTKQPGGTTSSADESRLYGVACASSSDCWAVGYYTNSAGAYINEVLHWNGSQWTLVSSPNPSGTASGEQNVLAGVTCISQSACFAVGYGRTAAGAQVNEALQWNGSAWSAVTTIPQPGGTGAGSYGYLQGLVCPSSSDCWADGAYANGAGASVNEVLHYDGTSWTQVPVPNPGGSTNGANNTLTSVSCAATSDCWAVGYYRNSAGAALNQALRFDGQKWSSVSTPQPGGTTTSGETNELLGVSCGSPSACWAVGSFTDDAGRTYKEALRWTGARWSDSSASFGLDGLLAATGSALCQSLPVPSTSINELSCQALQRTVQAGFYPGLWQMSQVLGATLEATPHAAVAARRQYASQLLTTLTQYADGLPFSVGLTPFAGIAHATRYYDDSAWAGLDLLAAYQQTGQPALLRAARGILSFEHTGAWRPSDPPDEQRYPGGIYWNTSRRTRPSVVTAGAAQVALRLYQLTHDRAALAFGEKEYLWLRRTMGTHTGLYRERIEPGGTITGDAADYVEGLMIGNGLILYHATGNRRYLDQATQTAKASLGAFTPPVLEATCPAIDAIFFANLMQLSRTVSLPAATQLLDTYASWVAQHSDSKTGAFTLAYSSCGGALPQAGASAVLILQATG